MFTVRLEQLATSESKEVVGLCVTSRGPRSQYKLPRAAGGRVSIGAVAAELDRNVRRRRLGVFSTVP